jgi:GDP-L-fucose synthase
MYSTLFKSSDFHKDSISFFKNKNVIVTGGTGFIGSHVVEQLLTLQSKPIVLSKNLNKNFLLSCKDDIEILEVDLFDKSKVIKAMKKADIVLHLAASVAGIEYNSKHPATIFKDNLEMFMNTIYAAANSNNIERFLVTSSACVYPRHCSIPTQEEEGVMGEPEPTNSGYGWSKRMEEYLGKKYNEEYDLSVAIARPYNAYGPRDNFKKEMSHVIPSLIKKAFESKSGKLQVWGDGTHSRSFLYVDDFARGLIEVAARYPKADPINIGANEETTIRELAYIVCDKVQHVTGEKLEPVFDVSGITGQPRRKCDTGKLEKELQFKTKVGFDEGMANTVNWYKNTL